MTTLVINNHFLAADRLVLHHELRNATLKQNKIHLSRDGTAVYTSLGKMTDDEVYARWHCTVKEIIRTHPEGFSRVHLPDSFLESTGKTGFLVLTAHGGYHVSETESGSIAMIPASIGVVGFYAAGTGGSLFRKTAHVMGYDPTIHEDRVRHGKLLDTLYDITSKGDLCTSSDYDVHYACDLKPILEETPSC